MTDAPFVRSGDGVVLHLPAVERAVLRNVPRILDEGGDGGGRLAYAAHSANPDAERRYQDLVAGSLDDLRREDRAEFDRLLAGDPTSPDGVEAFMRVVGEARLVLAARLGIEHDGWEYDSPDDPEMAMLGWLGWLQDAAIRFLSDGA